ncbi:phosphotransferase [Cellulomonas fimi]|uniref:phosphotransferase family protein n=1 Tax=Cellulomonas fimi TaxID=1708 RepID=UPI00234CD7A0|nr:phosphotransferase [Cellulomonas fimi]MDC7123478.1 phosphotransferase [Cellulomonas fimi]
MAGDVRVETGFVRPPGDLVDTLVAAALRSAGVRRASSGRWVESGSSALVLVRDDVVVRVARQPADSESMRRAQALVDELPPLPFAVPRSAGDAVEVDGYVAVPVRRLRGEPHPAGDGDPVQLRRLLDAVHGIDVAPLRPHLAPARHFAGGDAWETVLREEVVPRLDGAAREEAVARVDALAGLPAADRAVNHGDLAGSNVLWAGGRVSGVLDWDLTSWDDPAEDVAALVSWHGWSLLPEVADRATAARAEVFRRSFPLQLVAFAVVHARPALEVQRAVARAQERLQADAATRR